MPAASSERQHDETVLQVTQIAAQLLDAKAEDIRPSTSLRDLAADELDMVELVIELESHFGVSIPDELITNVTRNDDWEAGSDRLTMSKLAEIVDQQKGRGDDGAENAVHLPERNYTEEAEKAIRSGIAPEELHQRMRALLTELEDSPDQERLAEVHKAQDAYRARMLSLIVNLLNFEQPDSKDMASIASCLRVDCKVWEALHANGVVDAKMAQTHCNINNAFFIEMLDEEPYVGTRPRSHGSQP